MDNFNVLMNSKELLQKSVGHCHQSTPKHKIRFAMQPRNHYIIDSSIYCLILEDPSTTLAQLATSSESKTQIHLEVGFFFLGEQPTFDVI